MEDARNAGHGLATGGEIGDIPPKKLRLRGDPFPPSIDQAVQNPHPIAFGKQAFDQMAADESGTAGDEDEGHGKNLVKLPAEHSRRCGDGKYRVLLVRLALCRPWPVDS